MPKMQVNDDGTITFPLKGNAVVTLDEPSMRELAWMHAETEKIDGTLTVMPPISAASTPEEVIAFQEASATRTAEIYGEHDNGQPYGALVLQIVNKLGMNGDGTPVAVTEDDLYGWAASPSVMRTMLEHFRSPLPGKASLPNQ